MTHDVADAAQSGAIGDSQATWMETVVTGPGTLTFWWKVSSEANYDFVRFLVNGVLQERRSGEGAWVQESYVVGAGAQTAPAARTGNARQQATLQIMFMSFSSNGPGWPILS